MAESTCLHIQERESGPISIVEIPWISVRIGRASHCEVRLPGPDLAEEVCRLYRRGRTWQLVPVTAGSSISLDGRPVDCPCRLAFDVPFRIGPYCLTLRHDRTALPDWGMYSGPAPPPTDRVAYVLEAKRSASDGRDLTEPPGGSQPAIEPEAPPLPAAHGLGPNPELARTAGVREQWETRWRVAAAQLKARSQRPGGIPESANRSCRAGFDAVPLKEPQVPRKQAVVPPPNDLALDHAPGATKSEPDRTGLTAEPPEVRSPVEGPRTESNASGELVTADRRDLPQAGSEDRLDRGPAECPLESASLPLIDQAATVDLAPPQASRSFEPGPQSSSPRDPAVNRVEWPSAKDILETHRPTSQPRTTVATARVTTGRWNESHAMPTVVREPGHWNVPAWLAGPPATVLVLATGLAGCVLSWWWACDSYSASIMTDRLLSTDRAVMIRPLPESVTPPGGAWTRSTAQHLAHWAIFLSRYEGEGGHSLQEISALVERALQCSPLNPTARLAAAQLEPPGSSTTVSIRSLGQSRDVLSLAWSARRLLAAGEKNAALRMYAQSLSVAIPSEPSRADLARFSEDPSVQRYLLPGEERIRDIVREMAARNEWTISEWLAVLPDNVVVRLVAARLLLKSGRGEADALLDLILDERRTPAASGTVDPLTLAARAEAWALRSRWRDADLEYRQAIELIDDDTIKRSWWFNVADIASRLDDDPQRQAALRAALNVATSDDISRRAAETQRATRAQSVPRSTGVKAN